MESLPPKRFPPAATRLSAVGYHPRGAYISFLRPLLPQTDSPVPCGRMPALLSMPLALLIAAAPQQPPASAAPGLEPLQIRYTSGLTDQELRRRWLQDPAALGSISLGFVNRGRLINAVHMPEGDGWICEHDQLAWGTQETIDALVSVFTVMRRRFPGSARARLTQIGAREGGYRTPHR